jgi:hypothetical protein
MLTIASRGPSGHAMTSGTFYLRIAPQNQNQKRDKLPGAKVLRSVRQRIEEWWDRGYVKAENRVLSDRFMTEARATLPIVGGVEPRLNDVFAAVNLQQLRLKNDQQVPVWEPDVADS